METNPGALCATAGAALVLKDTRDAVVVGKYYAECVEEGTPRRCGGQGDVLAGVLATFIAWQTSATKMQGVEAAANEPAIGGGGGGGQAMSPLLFETTDAALQDKASALVAACAVTRRASAAAYAKRRRSLVAGDLIEEIGGERVCERCVRAVFFHM